VYFFVVTAVQNERDKIRIQSNGIENFGRKRYPDYITMLLQAEQICTQLRASLATITDISEAIKQQLIILVEWAKALPPFYELPLDDQVREYDSGRCRSPSFGHTRRNICYARFRGGTCCFELRESIRITVDACFSHVVFRILDEMVEPMRELNPDDTEYVCLKAILFFNPSLLSRIKVKQARFSFLDVLQTYITEQQHQDRLRLGGLLLLLPPLQAMSQQFIENLQLATLFGMCQFDKLLEELLLTVIEPPSMQQISQTRRSTPSS
ncbi:unnamed protein product, partial [Soboliphyme baturini]|uniref:NR LBD domain-containing protein n=1 Tax=Soboliphyme baturini TaxID=241478 RepID=A0A183J1U2_9BILA